MSKRRAIPNFVAAQAAPACPSGGEERKRWEAETLLRQNKLIGKVSLFVENTAVLDVLTVALFEERTAQWPILVIAVLPAPRVARLAAGLFRRNELNSSRAGRASGFSSMVRSILTSETM